MAGTNNNDTTTSPKVKRVLMYGNSHFKYLKNFINRSADPSQRGRFKKNLQNFCLKRDQVDLCGVGGIKTSHLVSGKKKKGINIKESFEEKIRAFKPHSLILWTLDNDIDENSTAEEVAMYIMYVCLVIRRKFKCIEEITICQALPRHTDKWHKDDAGLMQHVEEIKNYNKIAKDVHSILVQEVQNYAGVRFFQDYDFSLPGECKLRYEAGGNNYKPDGIHLNDGGLKVFYSAVRALVTSSD